MVDEVVFVARSDFVGRAVGAACSTATICCGLPVSPNDAWIERLGVFLLTSGVSRSGSTVMKIGPVLCPSPMRRAAAGRGRASRVRWRFPSTRQIGTKSVAKKTSSHCAISRIRHRRSGWRFEREWAPTTVTCAVPTRACGPPTSREDMLNMIGSSMEARRDGKKRFEAPRSTKPSAVASAV